jgi:drug/metabolite transporter (DMT)-like permease
MFEPRSHNPLLAALLILTATAFIAGTTLLAKALGSDALGVNALGTPLHPLQISHGRFLFACLAFLTVLAVRRRRLHAPDLRLHGARTLFGWLGVSLMFASVAHIPMADATAITFLNPVFAMMLAIPLLGEKVGPIRWSAAVAALIGAAILLRPTPASFQPAALLALAAAVSMGIELIFMKKLSGREPILQILTVNNLIGICIATVAVWPVWVAPTVLQWLALAGIGVLMACAQTAFLNGVARADASFVAPFSYATLVFAALYDLLFFGARPDAITLAGAGIILGGALVLALRERRVHQAPPVPK